MTKSFEYNNNRVLDVLNMATKSLICESFKPSDSSEAVSNADDTDIEDEADSVDIDITDMSSDEAADSPRNSERNDSSKTVNSNSIKKANKENLGQAMKNWLISDYPQRENSNYGQ